MSARMQRACEAWGEVPEYVKALIAACDEEGASQGKVAARLGYTPAVISQVISKKYPGDLDRVAAQVRRVLLQSVVTCPALGEIKELECIAWQNEAAELTSAAPTRVWMFRACRGCDLFGKGS